MELDAQGRVPQALQVIKDVRKIASTVTVNKPHCLLIADRFHAIKKGLKGVGQDQNFVDGKVVDGSGIMKVYPDLRELLDVLRTGEALVSRCRNTFIWTDKELEAFRKIHGELDTLKAQFDFESYCDGLAKDCDTVSGTMTTTPNDTEMTGDFSVPEYLRIDPSDIQLGKNIGSGANAEVYEATWSRCRCAVKRFKPSCMNHEYISKLQQELNFLIQLRHPYMVQLMGLSVDSDHRCSIVMEIMSCSLRGLIVSRLKKGKRVPFDFHEAVLIIRKIALGMRFVHSRGVSHRDLKAANVMVEERPGSIDVKVADFGESQFMDPSKPYGTAGTIAWMAPELLPPVATSSEPSKTDLKAADVYSFAMTCFEVLTGEKPFSGSLNRDQKNEVRSGRLRPELPVELDSRLKGLIEACWDSKPEKRPNFESIFYVLDQILRSKDPSTVVTGWSSGTESGSNIESKNKSESDSESESNGWHCTGISVPEYLRIKRDNLKTVEAIGEGAFGTVCAETWLGCRFAVKHLQLSEYMLKTVQHEIDSLIELRHPHVVQLVGITVDSRQDKIWCSIVMEIMSSDLQKLIDFRMEEKWSESSVGYRKVETLDQSVVVSDGPFDLHQAVLIVRKIALGMAFLHSRGVVHRDLKPSNVMVNEIPGSFDVKIADFGLSQHVMDTSGLAQGPVGTTMYMAPEVWASDSERLFHGDLKAADVYSFAITCYDIFTGEHPFEGLRGRELREAVVRGERPTLPAYLHPDLKELIEECWHEDPWQRPDFTYICNELQRIQQARAT